MKKKILLMLIVLSVIVGVFSFNVKKSQAKEDLGARLAGQIVLQVEEHGEAWYINPDDHKRYYLGRPHDAFNIMRYFGLGITNKNLNYLPIGLSVLSGIDTDGDGLPDDFEISQGTNIYKIDTDGDGYTDMEEILQNFSPLNPKSEKLYFDKSMQKRLSGKILLQVESLGEAWYVNPKDYKRYYLGRPTDAFNIMRNFGLGITNNDLVKIEKGENLILQVTKNLEKTNTNTNLVVENTNSQGSAVYLGPVNSSKSQSYHGSSSSAGVASSGSSSNNNKIDGGMQINKVTENIMITEREVVEKKINTNKLVGNNSMTDASELKKLISRRPQIFDENKSYYYKTQTPIKDEIEKSDEESEENRKEKELNQTNTDLIYCPTDTRSEDCERAIEVGKNLERQNLEVYYLTNNDQFCTTDNLLTTRR